MTIATENFTIDPEFSALLPAQTDVENENLRIKMQLDGCLSSAGVVGVFPDGERLLLDGHHSLAICKELGKNFPTPRELKMETREDALDWMVMNQLSRRNVTDEWRAYLIGKEYLYGKRPTGRPRNNVDNLSTLESQRTVEALAERHGVNEKTIRRSGEYAEAVDQIEKEEGHAAKQEILSGQSGMSREDVINKAFPPGPANDAIAAGRPVSTPWDLTPPPESSKPPKRATGPLCDRCKRVTPVEGCQACRWLKDATKRNVGGDKPTAPVQLGFDWDGPKVRIELLTKSVHDIVANYPGEEARPMYSGAIRLIEELDKLFVSWKKQLGANHGTNT